jgi:heme exporter protein B
MTNIINETKHLISKEINSELKQRYSLGGILLYVVSTVFVCYLSFKQVIDPPTWNALFWIIMIFASINAVAKSFIQESSGRLLYYYTLASPQAILFSKVIYNALLMLVLTFISYGIYSIFIGNLVQDQAMYFVCLLLGGIGFSSILTMVSAIASKTNNNFSLMAILSFPMLIPFLITLIKVSKNAMDGLYRGLSYKFILILVLINVLIVSLSYLLFPYLWKD